MSVVNKEDTKAEKIFIMNGKSVTTYLKMDNQWFIKDKDNWCKCDSESVISFLIQELGLD